MQMARPPLILVLILLAAEARAASQPELPPADREKIRTAAPDEAPARAQKLRKVLVFSKAEGFVHDSIPWGAAAIRILGEKTGAYEATLSDDAAMFDRDTLFQFDAVIFNNNCGNPIADAVRRNNLLEFVRGGRGLAGIHCAAHLDWPDYIEMLGGYSKDHPWNADSTVTVKVEEPDHSLLRGFADSSFTHTDEIFRFERFSRANVRVLLSLDAGQTDMNKPQIAPGERDFPLSWVRRYGKGRVFYSALGHQKDVYWQGAVLKHFLAGIQFALGDLDAEAAPRIDGAGRRVGERADGGIRVNKSPVGTKAVAYSGPRDLAAGQAPSISSCF